MPAGDASLTPGSAKLPFLAWAGSQSINGSLKEASAQLVPVRIEKPVVLLNDTTATPPFLFFGLSVQPVACIETVQAVGLLISYIRIGSGDDHEPEGLALCRRLH